MNICESVHSHCLLKSDFQLFPAVQNEQSCLLYVNTETACPAQSRFILLFANTVDPDQLASNKAI